MKRIICFKKQTNKKNFLFHLRRLMRHWEWFVCWYKKKNLRSFLLKNPSCLSLKYKTPSLSNLWEGWLANVINSCLLNLICEMFYKVWHWKIMISSTWDESNEIEFNEKKKLFFFSRIIALDVLKKIHSPTHKNFYILF